MFRSDYNPPGWLHCCLKEDADSQQHIAGKESRKRDSLLEQVMHQETSQVYIDLINGYEALQRLALLSASTALPLRGEGSSRPEGIISQLLSWLG